MKYCLGINERQCELMKSIDMGNLSEVIQLVKEGVDPSFRTNDSIAFNPLSLAAHKGHFEIVKWLVEEANCDYDEHFVSFIASAGQVEIADFLARRILK